MNRLRPALALLGGLLTLARAPAGEPAPPPPPSRDAVARLLQRVATGQVVFAGSDNDILRAVLRELGVPIESQVLVFSRSSMQGGLIRPDRPRALYFSDSVYVGWVPDGLIEAIAIDAVRGPIFYAFDPQDAREARRTFVRETSCLRCHTDNSPRGAPLLFARSSFTDESGEPLLRHGFETVDDATPFDRRWGGWYVTGYRGPVPHRGNAFAHERADRLDFTPSAARPAELADTFDVSRYLAATSDIVALLILEHQMAVQNSLTRASRASAPFDDVSEEVVDRLLFRDAAPLPDEIEGSHAFRQTFASAAKRSRQGDSLRDLSLRGRLFAHRCSFLVHSDSFAALPLPVRDAVLRRLCAALHDPDPHGRYAYLESDEKRRIVEILTETLPAFAALLKSSTPLSP